MEEKQEQVKNDFSSPYFRNYLHKLERESTQEDARPIPISTKPLPTSLIHERKASY